MREAAGPGWAASGCIWLHLAASGCIWLHLADASGCIWLHLAGRRLTPGVLRTLDVFRAAGTETARRPYRLAPPIRKWRERPHRCRCRSCRASSSPCGAVCVGGVPIERRERRAFVVLVGTMLATLAPLPDARTLRQTARPHVVTVFYAFCRTLASVSAQPCCDQCAPLVLSGV